MKQLALALALSVALAPPALAGSATVNYNSSGASAFKTTTDGSGNNLSQQTIWDSVAGANGLGITANNAAKTEGVGSAGTATGGVVTVQGVTAMTPVLVNPGTNASTTGNIVANNTTAVVVKASAGTLYGVQVYGIGSAPAYLKIYNATSATCGSGTPVKRLQIPAAATAANGAGSNITFGPQGVAFGTGITYCVTTGITDADATAPAANTFLVNLDWN